MRHPALPTPVASPHLDARRRDADLAALAGGLEVDVLVVGGGITGAGVALDAATRGLSVALLERHDLAHGTSRWSSKLVHGGLRYLAKGDVAVAWESAVERARIVETIAPHLVRALPFVVPAGEDLGPAAARVLATGLRLGDGLRRAAGTSGRTLPAARRISATEARRWVPGLGEHRLRGAYLHWDAQLEDDARLVVAVARTAAAHGARIVTRAAVDAVDATGADATDGLTGERFRVRARHVVSATGAWAAELHPGLRMRPSVGAHLLVPAARLGDPSAALTVPVPGATGRFVFALPRPDGLVLVGLTDDALDDPVIPDEPVVTAESEDFLLRIVSRALAAPLRPQDVVGRFAGVRPLLDAGRGATADVSRRHLVEEDPATGLVTVTGGKLTTYRRMAQDAVDLVARRPGVAAGPCVTTRLAAVGAGTPVATAPGDAPPARLVRRHGAEAADVAALAEGRPELLSALVPGVPFLGVEVLWAMRREGALDAADVLDRRLRASLVPAWREALAAPVAALVDAERAALGRPR